MKKKKYTIRSNNSGIIYNDTVIADGFHVRENIYWFYELDDIHPLNHKETFISTYPVKSTAIINIQEIEGV